MRDLNIDPGVWSALVPCSLSTESSGFRKSLVDTEPRATVRSTEAPRAVLSGSASAESAPPANAPWNPARITLRKQECRERPLDSPGDPVGSNRLVRRLGEGGMAHSPAGRADRPDDQPTRSAEAPTQYMETRGPRGAPTGQREARHSCHTKPSRTLRGSTMLVLRPIAGHISRSSTSKDVTSTNTAARRAWS